MKKKIIFAVALLLLLALPTLAVFNEKDLGQTLSVLRYELKSEYARMGQMKKMGEEKRQDRREQMIETLKKCNKLSLILYSQKTQDYTLDMTYALKEVSQAYENYNENRMPYDDLIQMFTLEREQYQHLVAALKRMPPEIDDDDAPEVADSLVLVDSVGLKIRARIDSLRREGKMNEFTSLRKDVNDANAIERRNAFMLDSVARVNRDTCLFYASQLLMMYNDFMDRTVSDSKSFDSGRERLEEAYNYAQERYKVIQTRIFKEGQDDYVYIIKNFKRYAQISFRELKEKYSGKYYDTREARAVYEGSEWRGTALFGLLGSLFGLLVLSILLSVGLFFVLSKLIASLRTPEMKCRMPVIMLLLGTIIFTITIIIWSKITDSNFFAMACGLMLTFSWLMIAILLSLIIRADYKNMRHILKVYLPMIVLGFVIIFVRVIFLPNNIINLLFPPVMLLFCFWQVRECDRLKKNADTLDLVLGWISLAIMVVSTGMAFLGFVLLSIQVLIWWLFQISAIATIMSLSELLGIYKEKVLIPRIERYQKEIGATLPQMKSGAHIKVTWFFDFIKKTILPIMGVLSVPFCLWYAADIFDITAVCKTIFFYPFLDIKTAAGGSILHLSMYKILLCFGMYFMFNYLSYLIRSAYALLKLRSYKKQIGRDVIRTNEVNLTLANNVVGILVWGTYIVVIILLLKIPIGAISMVFAGLATGLGLAMKDLLNNFIYGIQLMSGRLRVGDYIECEQFRGKVTSISYQSTQIETEDGAVVSFLNADLFARNFKNLTRNNSYEYLKIIVGVSYGTDVEKARAVILEALEKLAFEKDKYKRTIVDKNRGITVNFEGFGDSSVDIGVVQFVLVSSRRAYKAHAQEVIYNALNEAGIEIPFPQVDVHAK